MNWIQRNISRTPRFLFVFTLFCFRFFSRRKMRKVNETLEESFFFLKKKKHERTNSNEWIENYDDAVCFGVVCDVKSRQHDHILDERKKPTRKIKQVSINISRNSISSFYRWIVKDLNCICGHYHTVGFCGLNQYTYTAARSTPLESLKIRIHENVEYTRAEHALRYE